MDWEGNHRRRKLSLICVNFRLCKISSSASRRRRQRRRRQKTKFPPISTLWCGSVLRGNGPHRFTTPQLPTNSIRRSGVIPFASGTLFPSDDFRKPERKLFPEPMVIENFSIQQRKLSPIRRKISTETEPAAPSICEYGVGRLGLAP